MNKTELTILIIGAYFLAFALYIRWQVKKKARYHYDPTEQVWVKVETLEQCEECPLIIMITVADHPSEKGLVLSEDMKYHTYRSAIAAFKNLEADHRVRKMYN